MVNGRINRVIEAQRLAADRALQQRLLGVGRHGHDDAPLPSRRPRQARGARAPGRPRVDARLRVESDAADALVTARAGRQDRGDGAHQRGEHRFDRGGRPPAPKSGRSPRAAAGRDRRRHARYQGRGAALHSRPAQAERSCARGSSISPPAASIPRRTSRRTKSRCIIRAARPACSPAIAAHRSPRWRRRSRPGSAPERHRRHHLGRRLRRDRAGDAGDAPPRRSACRRS